jgi:hypothetical protein
MKKLIKGLRLIALILILQFLLFIALILKPIQWLKKQFYPTQPNIDIPTEFKTDLQQAKAAQTRYQEQSGGLAALDEAIEAWERILTHPEFAEGEETFRLRVLNNSAGTYLRRYSAAGAFKDLEIAIAAWQQAVALTKKHVPNSPDLPSRLNNLGNGLRNRYASTGEIKDLAQGIQAYQDAVALTKKHVPNSPDLPSILKNLGTGLRNRYASTGEIKDLAQGIQAFQDAVALTKKHVPNSPDLPSILNNLGTGLTDRYASTGEIKDLEQGIQAYEDAVALTKKHVPNSPDLPMFLNNLGTGLTDRYASTGEIKDLERGKQAYEQATQQGLESATEVSLGSARNWLYWAFRREAWLEVAKAYHYAYQASTRLVQIQSMRQHQALWLKKTQGLAAHAAYAFAKENKLQQAVVTLEGGLAQLLSEALGRDRADLEALKEIGRGNLYERYQHAVNDWLQAQAMQADEKGAARDALHNTIADIRTVEGYADFFMPPKFEEIQAAAQKAPLVYLAVTKAGGVALIVSDDEPIRPVWLPELTEDKLAHTLINSKGPDFGYFYAYYNWLKHPNASDSHEQWLTRLTSITQLLWQQIMGPVIEALPKQAAVTLIPAGHLALLPLHAAWTEDQDRPSGKCYALDVLTISYAPNARSLGQARKIAARSRADRQFPL